MKNNNFKNFIIFIIIFQLLQEEEKKNNIYNLINLSNLNKMERLIIEEKDKQIFKETIQSKNEENKHIVNKKAQLKNDNSQQLSKMKIELKEEKNEQIGKELNESKNKARQQASKINTELNKEKSKQVPKANIKLRNEKSKQIWREHNELKKENNNTRKNIFSKIPIVIASFETEITEIVFTKIKNTFIDIKEVKNNIFIEEANLIKLNSNKAELFISGYIRSYIEYITLDKINENFITTKNQGIISHKDFSKAININLLFFNNMKEGEVFFVDFNNYIKDKKVLLGKIEKLDIKSSNIYKDVEGFPFEREKCYLTLQQNLLIRAKINVLQNNVVIL